ncbi:MAG: nuclear transport factor 2 family protein [Alphaproteobacteria bacterium]|nr:nuclear transport factor 2 family protein [Alphaproteobacteria bacterium]
MKRLGLALAACVLLSTAATANMPPPQVTSRDMANDAVVAFMENFNAGNLEGLASTYSDGGSFVWVENGHIAADSKAAAVEANGKMPKGARMETDSSMQVIMIGTSAAEAVVPFTFYVKDDKGADTEAFKGVMTLTIAPDTDGTWRIVAGHMSASGRH